MRKQGQTDWRPLVNVDDMRVGVESTLADLKDLDEVSFAKVKRELERAQTQYEGIQIQIMHVGYGAVSRWHMEHQRARWSDRKEWKKEFGAEQLSEEEKAETMHLFRAKQIESQKHVLSECVRGIKYPDGSLVEGDQAVISELERIGALSIALKQAQEFQQLREEDIFTEGVGDMAAV